MITILSGVITIITVFLSLKDSITVLILVFAVVILDIISNDELKRTPKD